MEVQVQVVDRDGIPVVEIADAFIGEAPTWKLNRPGSFQFTVDPTDAAVQALNVGGSHEVICRLGGGEAQGGLTWQGLLGVPVAQGGPTGRMLLQAESLEAIFDARVVKATLDFRGLGLDQHTIGGRLVEHAQDETIQGPGADVRIVVANVPDSGITRDRIYPVDEHGNIGHLLGSFTEIRNGYDWSVEVFDDGRREWTPWFPARGTRRAADVLELGRNLVDFEWTEDGQVVTEAIVLGQGDGPDRMVGHWRDDVAAAEHGLFTVTIHAPGNVTEQSWLDDRAREEVEARKDPAVRVTNLEIRDHNGNGLLTRLRPGDTVPVRIDRGRIRADGDFRITSAKVDPYTERAKLEVQPT